MAEKVTSMVLKVDLHCPSCYQKIKKILCKFPEIRDQVYDEKKKEVKIAVVGSSPEKIKEKLLCKGGKVIKSIDILPPPKVEKKEEKKEEKPPQKKDPPTPKFLVPGIPVVAIPAKSCPVWGGCDPCNRGCEGRGCDPCKPVCKGCGCDPCKPGCKGRGCDPCKPVCKGCGCDPCKPGCKDRGCDPCKPGCKGRGCDPYNRGCEDRGCDPCKPGCGCERPVPPRPCCDNYYYCNGYNIYGRGCYVSSWEDYCCQENTCGLM